MNETYSSWAGRNSPEDLPLADRYQSAEPIVLRGSKIYPMYTEQVGPAPTAVTLTLLSAAPPPGLRGLGMGVSVVNGYVALNGRRLAGVDVWSDALVGGITFDIVGTGSGTLVTLTPVWVDAFGEQKSWVGNYGIVIETTPDDRIVLWCSIGEGPANFANLVLEVQSAPIAQYGGDSVPASPTDTAPTRPLRSMPTPPSGELPAIPAHAPDPGSIQMVRPPAPNGQGRTPAADFTAPRAARTNPPSAPAPASQPIAEPAAGKDPFATPLAEPAVANNRPQPPPPAEPAAANPRLQAPSLAEPAAANPRLQAPQSVDPATANNRLQPPPLAEPPAANPRPQAPQSVDPATANNRLQPPPLAEPSAGNSPPPRLPHPDELGWNPPPGRQAHADEFPGSVSPTRPYEGPPDNGSPAHAHAGAPAGNSAAPQQPPAPGTNSPAEQLRTEGFAGSRSLAQQLHAESLSPDDSPPRTDRPAGAGASAEHWHAGSSTRTGAPAPHPWADNPIGSSDPAHRPQPEGSTWNTAPGNGSPAQQPRGADPAHVFGDRQAELERVAGEQSRAEVHHGESSAARQAHGDGPLRNGQLPPTPPLSRAAQAHRDGQARTNAPSAPRPAPAEGRVPPAKPAAQASVEPPTAPPPSPPPPPDDAATVDTGYRAALYDLGVAMYSRGEEDQACGLWAQAAEAGHPGAAYDLGVVRFRRGDLEDAERWWRTAADRREPRAMAGLAELLDRQGNYAEARVWRACADEERSTNA